MTESSECKDRSTSRETSVSVVAAPSVAPCMWSSRHAPLAFESEMFVRGCRHAWRATIALNKAPVLLRELHSDRKSDGRRKTVTARWSTALSERTLCFPFQLQTFGSLSPDLTTSEDPNTMPRTAELAPARVLSWAHSAEVSNDTDLLSHM